MDDGKAKRMLFTSAPHQTKVQKFINESNNDKMQDKFACYKLILKEGFLARDYINTLSQINKISQSFILACKMISIIDSEKQQSQLWSLWQQVKSPVYSLNELEDQLNQINQGLNQLIPQNQLQQIQKQVEQELALEETQILSQGQSQQMQQTDQNQLHPIDQQQSAVPQRNDLQPNIQSQIISIEEVGNNSMTIKIEAISELEAANLAKQVVTQTVTDLLTKKQTEEQKQEEKQEEKQEQK